MTLGLLGAAGRMGRRIIQLSAADPAFRIAFAVDRPGAAEIGQDAGTLAGAGPLGVRLATTAEVAADVVIDFSSPAASVALLPACAGRGAALVVGTTGFAPDQRRQVEALADQVPVLISANFSRAVYVLMRLVARAAALLGESADVEIVERHHRSKADAPSGTALRLAECVAASRGLDPDSYVHGRSGHTGARPRDQIGLHALRTADNPGEHTVVFGLTGECLELSHRALNRDGFVLGALDAAKQLANRPAGLYSMDDLVGPGGD